MVDSSARGLTLAVIRLGFWAGLAWGVLFWVVQREWCPSESPAQAPAA
jgi:hypothetical protein